MMASNKVEDIVEKIINGTASQADIREVANLITLGKLALATGERSISLSGNASGAVIVTGDNNQVVEVANAAAVRALLRDNLENVVQLGKYNVNIGEGREIHIGDRLYRDVDAEAIREIVRNILVDIQQGAPAEEIQEFARTIPDQPVCTFVLMP